MLSPAVSAWSPFYSTFDVQRWTFVFYREVIDNTIRTYRTAAS